jgi:hypothetical protein
MRQKSGLTKLDKKDAFTLIGLFVLLLFYARFELR